MKRLRSDGRETAGDESRLAEFEALFLQHWARVYRHLRGLVGDPAEAEDLALETFVRLYQQQPEQDAQASLGGWLYRVATNLGLQSIRGWKRRQHYETTAGRYALVEARQDSPAEIQAEREEHSRVRQALAGMSERQSQLLVLRHSGLSYREIAQALDLAPASIGPLLVRAEREFEKQYRALAEED